MSVCSRFGLVLLCLFGLALGTASLDARAAERPEFVPGELIVKFRTSEPAEARSALLNRFGLTEKRQLLGTRAVLVSMPAGASEASFLTEVRRAAEVEYADLNFYRYLDAVPDDPRFDELYGMHNLGQNNGTFDADIDAVEAWDLETGSEEVVVAVLDSGLDLDHSDIAANLYVNPGEIPGNGVDDDGNGFVDDVSGWDFRNNDADASASGGLCLGHGTHVAGTVGAVGDNGIGVTGVAQTVKLMPLRAFYLQFILCTAQDSDLIDAIGYAGMMGVRVSNHSWGGGGFSNAMLDAIRGSRHLFVNSAGNGNLLGVGFDIDSNPVYPASYDLDHILVVGSTDKNDRRSGFSNFGSEGVDLAAPGSGILSTGLSNGYRLLDGTSMSSPHVAGAAALLLSQDPTATTAELKNRLMRGTDPINFQSQTNGRLNAFNSLTLPSSEVIVAASPLGPIDVAPGDTLDYTVDVTNTVGSSRTVQASIRIWLPNGVEVPLVGPVELTLGPSGATSADLSVTLPIPVAAGEYRLIARVEDGDLTFDEDQILYAVN